MEEKRNAYTVFKGKIKKINHSKDIKNRWVTIKMDL
jgi:hypothetical protein